MCPLPSLGLCSPEHCFCNGDLTVEGMSELNYSVPSWHTAGDSDFPLNPNLHFYVNALSVKN